MLNFANSPSVVNQGPEFPIRLGERSAAWRSLFADDLEAGLQIAADPAALNPDWNAARVGAPG